ncbi:MAG: LamG-like jellyroll fold domain-containing protein [Candidatus Eisenbacteria bacterium]
MRLAHARSPFLSRGRSILLPATCFASFLLLASLASAAPFTPDAHTTLLLHFDGDALGAHHETPLYESGTTFAAGRIGSAIHLDANSDLRHARDGNFDGTRGSIEFWLKPDWAGNDGQDHTVLECGEDGGVLVAKDAAGNLRIILNRYGPNGTGELGIGTNVNAWTAGVWHHVAFTWTPTRLRVYTDGTLRGTTTPASAPPALADAELHVGRQQGGEPLAGWLDDLRVSANERTASEIATAAAGNAVANDGQALLVLRFDGDANGAAGAQAIAATSLTYESGIFAQAARLTNATDLRWLRQGHLRGESGTIECWLKPAFAGGDGTNHVLLACGTWGGLMAVRDGGDYLRLIANRWSPNGTPELGTGLNVNAWTPDAWHHVAFTWSAAAIEVYVDGARVARTIPAQAPPALADAEFRLGRETTADGLDALVDELRVSDVARDSAEIAASFMAGLTITALHVTPDAARLWSGWPLRTTCTGETAIGTVPLPASAITWTSSDEGVLATASGTPRAAGAGTAIATAHAGAASAGVSVTVRAPVLAPTHEALPADLTTPIEHAAWDVPVLVIRYFATADGENLDTSISPDFWEPGPLTLSELDARVLAMNRRAKFALEQGSRFRAYANPHARASLGYHVVDQVTVYEQTPPGKIVGDDGGHPIREPDWFEIFDRLDVRRYVEELGVKEVWVWLGGLGAWPSFDPLVHSYEDFRGGWESNMSSPLTGDISNSNRDGSDLPVYDRTYVVYGYNFRRSQAEAVHDHGHQLESQFAHVNGLQDGNDDLFWKRWRGRDESGAKITGRCGDTHSPPNTLDDYDYENPATVESDIADWTPDGSGAWSNVNVHTWGDLAFAWPDGESEFGQRVETQWYMYWMMSMPGFANGLHDGGEAIENWWRFVGDWDGSVSGGNGLHTAFDPLGTGDDVASREPLVLARFAPNRTHHRGDRTAPGAAAPLVAAVYDLQGRRVRVLHAGPAPAGAGRLAWDLRDDGGVRVAPGVYLLRAGVPGCVATRKLCVVR